MRRTRSNMETILCKWNFTISEKKGWTIAKYKFQNSKEGYFVALGEQLPTNPYVLVKLVGEWNKHTYRGKEEEQFFVKQFSESIPEDLDSFEKFLSSGAIPGIGKVLSKRIIEAYGTQAQSVLKDQPEELLQLKGFTPKKVKAIEEYFESGTVLEEIANFFHYLLTQKQVKDIFDAFGHQAVSLMKESVFHLYEVQGFRYQEIYSLAKSLGCIQSKDPYRIRAAILEVLRNHAKKGHTYLCLKPLENQVYDLLKRSGNVEREFIQIELLKVANPLLQDTVCGIERYEVNGEIRYALTALYKAETYISKRVVQLSMQEDIICEEKMKELEGRFGVSKEAELTVMDHLIQEYMDETNLLLSQEQKDAVIAAQRKKFLIVTGGPGTGKTTIEKFMIHLMQILRPEKKIALLAPTGRAARRMAESTGYHQAHTIHSAIRLFGVDDLLEYQGESSLHADIIFVDEFSMVDTMVFMCLLKAMKKGTQLIMIGDPDQLPSVQSGNVFRDMIDSEIIPIVRLKHVFRQSVGSLISCNAQLINRGETDVCWNQSDFMLVETSGAEDVEAETVKKILGVYGNLLQKNSYHQVQILTPFRKEKSGKNGSIRHTSVDALNKKLQQIANIYVGRGPYILHHGTKFYQNDKIMESSNQTHEELANGDIGIITNVEKNRIQALFNDVTGVSYDKSEMGSLSLAYATTIHKSQGSEYDWVIIPILRSFRGMLSRQLLYTAVTRAKKGVIFVGEYAAFLSAVRDDFTVVRETSLKDFILIEYQNYQEVKKKENIK